MKELGKFIDAVIEVPPEEINSLRERMHKIVFFLLIEPIDEDERRKMVCTHAILLSLVIHDGRVTKGFVREELIKTQGILLFSEKGYDEILEEAWTSVQALAE